jgi:hypothetical protein
MELEGKLYNALIIKTQFLIRLQNAINVNVATKVHLPQRKCCHQGAPTAKRMVCCVKCRHLEERDNKAGNAVEVLLVPLSFLLPLQKIHLSLLCCVLCAFVESKFISDSYGQFVTSNERQRKS